MMKFIIIIQRIQILHNARLDGDYLCFDAFDPVVLYRVILTFNGMERVQKNKHEYE